MINSRRLIYLSFAFAITGCGDGSSGEDNQDSNQNISAPVPVPAPAPEAQLELAAPAEINVEAAGLTTQTTLGKAVAGGGNHPVSITNNMPSKGFPLGQTTVIWTAIDADSATATATQSVIVSDTIAPTIKSPANIYITATGKRTSVDIGKASANDRVDSEPKVTHNAPRRGFLVGSTTVKWTATDASNNSAIATQTIVVEEAAVADDACMQAETLYTNTVKNDLDTHLCFGCHIVGGVASATNLVLDRVDDDASLNAFRGYLANGSSAISLLNKTLNIPSHTGGNLFDSDTSAEYKNLQSLLSLLTQCNATAEPDPEIDIDPDGNTLLLSKVSLERRASTLRRASIILAGRLPAENEHSQVIDDNSLRTALRSLMTGEGFIDFIYRSGNEWFLTQNLTFNDYYARTGGYTTDEAAALDSDSVTNLSSSLKREPLELLRFIVDNNRPFSEIVTANYTLANNDLAKLYKAAEINLPGAAAAGWRPVKYPFASDINTSTAYPHAGVISTAAWLTRFPTTATNRNRHRINTLYQQFLGVDIEATAARPIDNPDGVGKVPVMTDSSCTVCHSYLDPAAGAFMDFAGDGEINGRIYRHFGDHSLTEDYTHGIDYPLNPSGDAWYQTGDIWYRDMFKPGFEGVAMPGGIKGFEPSLSNNAGTSALSWIAHELVKDPRFAKAGVYFWFETLYGRKPLNAPIIETDTHYARDLKAFKFEDELISKFAEKFASTNYVVRDLLIEMVMSPLFRADSVTESLSPEEKNILSNLGVGRLLTAPEINNLSKSMLKKPDTSDVFKTVFTGLGYIHDGFDGASSEPRNRQATSITRWAVDNRIGALVCNKELIREDFAKPAAQRIFVPHVEPSNIPGTTDGDQRIRQNIQHLHRYLLGEDLAMGDPDLDRTYNLFTELFTSSTEETDVGVVCDGTVFYRNGLQLRNPYPDPYGTRRAWNAVLIYLLTDLNYLGN